MGIVATQNVGTFRNVNNAAAPSEQKTAGTSSTNVAAQKSFGSCQRSTVKNKRKKTKYGQILNQYFEKTKFHRRQSLLLPPTSSSTSPLPHLAETRRSKGRGDEKGSNEDLGNFLTKHHSAKKCPYFRKHDVHYAPILMRTCPSQYLGRDRQGCTTCEIATGTRRNGKLARHTLWLL